MIDPTHQCPHHAFHFQFKKQSCHTIHRNIGFHYQYVDMQVAQTCKDADHKFFYVKVSDSGMGIPQDSIDKIWQRFYKTDLSRGRDKTGSGIGLAIVKEIIMGHNETIDVISTEGVGTEFVFSLKKSKR